MMITLPCKIYGKTITIPNEILIIEKFNRVPQNTHFVLGLFDKQNMSDTFKILLINGKPAPGYLKGVSFLTMKYIECSLEQYKNMKVFL